jgi:hypothetical protein
VYFLLVKLRLSRFSLFAPSLVFVGACTSEHSGHRAADADASRPASLDGSAPADAAHVGLPHDGGHAPRDAHITREASSGPPDGAAVPEGAVPARRDAGSVDHDAATATEAGAADAGVRSIAIPGWSVRKHVLEPGGDHLVLEEVLTSFTEAAPGPNRIQRLGRDGAERQSYLAPAGAYLSDFCTHPSGEISAVLIDAGAVVSLVRLDAALTPLVTRPIHDPDVPTDVHVDGGPKDLFANGFARDAARIASAGEDVVAVVFSSFISVIAYRAPYANGSWSSPARTLVEPPQPVTPFLPIGGSFDTFGAIVAWFRAVLDTDEDGNAYVAIWAHPLKIRAHDNAFHDGLAPLYGTVDSDVLLTRLNRDGARAWSRVVGTEFEDEPYALRAARGQVAVVGRSRRQPGFDNTFWDAFVSVSSTAGDLVSTRAIPFDASSILLAADVTPSGTWVFGGSDGWSQNPDGLSVLTFGTKLLFALPAIDGDPVRYALPPGPRHDEVRAVAANASRLWYAGHEDGPIMHTGDSDPSLIRATGVLGEVDR